MNNNKRAVIIHCHMFKNAGTTFDWSLKRFFGRSFIDHRDNEKMIKGGIDYLKGILRELPDVKALSSHHVQFPLPLANDIQLLPAILVRHPVDRVGSVYSFERGQTLSTPSSVNARRMAFAEYIEWCMNPDAPAVIRNYQTLYLMGRAASPNELIKEEEFDALIESLSHYPLLGVVDQYDQSMVLFEKELSKMYPQIYLSYVRKNVSAGRKADLEERIDDVRQELEGSLFNLLIEKNSWDIKLYSAVKKILNDRINQTDRFQEQLCVFQKKCQALEKYKWILNSEMLWSSFFLLKDFVRKFKSMGL